MTTRTKSRLQPTVRQARLVPLAAIRPNPKNPRQDPAAADLPGLADSLDRLDLLNAIQIRPSGPGRFVVIAGERRYRAAKLAGWKEISAIVRDDVDDATAATIMVAENFHQRRLNAIEKARALQLLLAPKTDGGAGLTHVQVAAMLKKSRPWVSNLVRLLALPVEWQRRVADGQLSEPQGRALLAYAERPDILAAVAEDMRTNPNDWQWQTFDARLAAVVTSIDALAAARVSKETLVRRAAGNGDNVAPLPAAAAALRRSAPVDHTEAREAIKQICKLVDQVDSLDALDVIQEHIHARAVFLRRPCPKPKPR